MKILVIAAHADDAELSVGGTIAKYAPVHDIKLLTLILPHEDREGLASQVRKGERLMAQGESATILGLKNVDVLDMDPYTLAYNRDLVKRLDNHISSYAPDLIFTHWVGDSHQNHRHVCQATFSAARENKCSVLMYHQLVLGGLTPQAFQPQVFVDISKTMKTKMEAIKRYKFISDEKLNALEAIARFNGSQIGVHYAECFQVGKIIVK